MLYWQPFVIFIAKSDANCMFTCSEYSRIFLIQCRSFRKRTNYFGEIYLAQNLLAQLRPVDYFNCNFLLRDTVHSKLHQPCRNETKFIISSTDRKLSIKSYRSALVQEFVREYKVPQIESRNPPLPNKIFNTSATSMVHKN